MTADEIRALLEERFGPLKELERERPGRRRRRTTNDKRKESK